MSATTYDSGPRLVSAADLKARYPRVIARVRGDRGMVEVEGRIVARTLSSPVRFDVRLDDGRIECDVYREDVELIEGGK